MEKKYKVGLISLGCAKNLVDSEMILGMLNSSNFEVVNSIEKSDVIIVNTCGFIEDSKKESIENILDVISYNKVTVVTGCLVERYKDELKEAIPEVDLWVAIKDYPHFNEMLMALLKQNVEVNQINPFVRMLSTPPYMAYLRISEGCNNCCSYCAIPLIRGRFRSRPFDDVILEANMLAKEGIKELVIISQDTTRYGSDLNGDINIVTLLKELVKIPGFISIRLLYLYPDEISVELIDFIKDNKIIAPYFDIPFQHSSDKILKAMNRRGTNADYQQLLDLIRKKIPHAIIRTTYIVGFPGETDDDFVNLVAFTRKNHFDHMGAFKYSREEGTASFDMDNQVNEALKTGRLNKIMDVQKKISYENNKTHIGEIMEGIVIGFNPSNNTYSLRSYWNAPDDIDGTITFTSENKVDIGGVVKVKITNAFVYDLYGTLVN